MCSENLGKKSGQPTSSSNLSFAVRLHPNPCENTTKNPMTKATSPLVVSPLTCYDRAFAWQYSQAESSTQARSTNARLLKALAFSCHPRQGLLCVASAVGIYHQLFKATDILPPSAMFFVIFTSRTYVYNYVYVPQKVRFNRVSFVGEKKVWRKGNNFHVEKI